MSDLISYSDSNRHRFDNDTQKALDGLRAHFSQVEIEGPTQMEGKPAWFVQIYRNRVEGLPEGLYGTTVLEAATRLTSALGLKSKKKL